MGAFKWIGGLLGWVSGGVIGALIGYLVGSLAESGLDAMNQLGGGTGSYSGSNTRTGTGSRSGSYTGGQAYRRTGYSAEEQRNSFMVSLLVLCSAVIRADGRTHPAELSFVREFLRSNFGESSVEEGMKILDGLNSQEINIYSVGTQIASNMNYSQRQQLFHYLVQLAAADNDFCEKEKSVLESIASAIRLNTSDAASIIAMFYKDNTSAYTVLGISPSATDDEVKAAYRKMAMKHHPDKVATLGPEVQKAAEEKFRQIQQAYEAIKKERGIN